MWRPIISSRDRSRLPASLRLIDGCPVAFLRLGFFSLSWVCATCCSFALSCVYFWVCASPCSSTLFGGIAKSHKDWTNSNFFLDVLMAWKARSKSSLHCSIYIFLKYFKPMPDFRVEMGEKVCLDTFFWMLERSGVFWLKWTKRFWFYEGRESQQLPNWDRNKMSTFIVMD